MTPQADTVGQLIASHQQRLYGYFVGRVRDDAVAKDLTQETWVEVWRHAETFDPARGGFWTFTRIWAEFVLRRHRAGMAAQRQRVVDRVEVGADDPDSSATGVAGAGRAGFGGSGGVEHAVEVAAAFAELLMRLARCARPPHEVVVFGLSKLGWKPREIVAQVADVLLDELATRVEQDYAAAVPGPAVHAALEPLRRRLACPLAEVVRDPRTRNLCRPLLDRIVGTTTLREYFPNAEARSPEAAIVHWWHAVQRAVITETARDGKGNLFEWLHAYGG